MISMNITSPPSSLEQTNFVLEDWGTNLSDSSIEFSFRTCSVAMEANGLGCGCGLEVVFPGLPSSCSTITGPLLGKNEQTKLGESPALEVHEYEAFPRHAANSRTIRDDQKRMKKVLKSCQELKNKAGGTFSNQFTVTHSWREIVRLTFSELASVHTPERVLFEIESSKKSLPASNNTFNGLKQASKSLIHQSPRGIFINQSKYPLEILKKHRLDKCDSIGTPMATKPKLDADLSETPFHQTRYQSMIGSLMYLTSNIPDFVQALTDMFKKALSQERFEYLAGRFGMRCLTPLELEVLANGFA
ncbi:hypothetical protein Tco_1330153 [Tanacetum coccineum]